MILGKSKIYYKLTAILMAFMMIGNVSFAAVMTDVTESHWANTVVQHMVDEDIMAIYEDNSFKPNETATKAETLIVIYRAAIAAGLLTASEGATLADTYESQLEALNIPKMLAPYGGDVYPALGYALENDIVVMDEVKYFVNEGAFTGVSRVEASVFFGKALNLYKNENLNKIISLSYKDAFEISLSALKYVNLLIDYNIVSAKGDSNGNFNPKTILNRAVLAVFADGYFGAITTGVSEIPTTDPEQPSTVDSEDPVTGDPDTPVTGDVETAETPTVQTVTGTITDIFSDLKYLEVKSTAGKVATYNVKSVPIYADQVAISLDHLKAGIAVTLTIENSAVTRVDVPLFFDSVSGSFNSISGYLGTEKDFRSLKIALDSGGFDFKRVYADTRVIVDGVSADIDDLKNNYYLTIYYQDYTAMSIVAYSDNYEFKGMLTKEIPLKGPTSLEVTLEDGTQFKAPISDGVAFSNVTGNRLNENDIVNVKLVYGKVKSIAYAGVVRDIKGIIKGIYIKAESEIALDTGAKEYEIVAVDPNLNIIAEDGEEGLNIYDLRLDQIANVHIGFDGIEVIRLGDEADIEAFNATVTSVITTSNIMIVVDDSGISKTIAFAKNSNLDIADYMAGDKLYISGRKITEGLFEADHITSVTQ
ncbi:MAG: hypothetical protein PWP51_455 [Clostridiales bacterium]|jgi:hypothetical protein|nr:hypothetical protein [Clostridiales bacterium]